MTGLRLGILIMAFLAAGCAPRVQGPGPFVAPPGIDGDRFIAADGTALPLRRWLPKAEPLRAVIVALHGFNDYGKFFETPGTFLADRGIASYAYDQRGFGATARPGLWPGVKALTDDLKAVARQVRTRHPGLPLYLLGASMGGAVIMVSETGDDPPAADGVILSAPAVWGRSTMPAYQRGALWLAARLVPWLKLSGRGLRRRASDNVAMLRALGRDPLVIKETRIDALWGLTNLMDAALDAASRFDAKALILLGANDEIIPAEPNQRMIARLPPSPRRRMVRYPSGFHMLLRDLKAEIVWRDIAAWIADGDSPLPSDP